MIQLGVQDERTANSYIDRGGPAVWDWSLLLQIKGNAILYQMD